jgi:hypothetical protein
MSVVVWGANGTIGRACVDEFIGPVARRFMLSTFTLQTFQEPTELLLM